MTTRRTTPRAAAMAALVALVALVVLGVVAVSDEASARDATAAGPPARTSEVVTAATRRLRSSMASPCRRIAVLSRSSGCAGRQPGRSTLLPVVALVRAASRTVAVATASHGSTGTPPSPRSARAKAG